MKKNKANLVCATILKMTILIATLSILLLSTWIGVTLWLSNYKDDFMASAFGGILAVGLTFLLFVIFAPIIFKDYITHYWAKTFRKQREKLDTQLIEEEITKEEYDIEMEKIAEEEAKVKKIYGELAEVS